MKKEDEKMTDKKNPWFYVSWLPLLMACIGLTVSTMAHLQGWGAEKNGSTIISVFFCEITFVVSMLGLVSYMRQPNKTTMVKNIRWLNVTLVLMTLLISIYFFLR